MAKAAQFCPSRFFSSLLGGVTQRFSTADRIASAEYQGSLRRMNAQKHEVYIAMNAVEVGARITIEPVRRDRQPTRDNI